MNRTDIETLMAAKLETSPAEASVYLKAALESIADCLSCRQTVKIQNFGTFHPWHQTSRPVRNPRTGEPCMLKPRLSVKFTPGKGLLEQIEAIGKLAEKEKNKKS